MRICILGQEEPVYFGPFLRGIIQARPEEIAGIVIAGKRGAGDHASTAREKALNVLTLWLLMEPSGFARNAFISLWQALIMKAGLTGSWLDKRSFEGAALGRRIPVIRTCNINSEETRRKISDIAPDIIINQTELLLKRPLLQVPRLGVINRHASLLPHFRGRLASFRAHANEPPEYGVTIHFVDEGLDSGPIVLQRKFDMDPRLSYTDILDLLFRHSVPLMLEALDLLKSPKFIPVPNRHEGSPVYAFPTLEEVRAYRRVLRRRRSVLK